MIADVEFEVLVHIGSFHALDLRRRGIYFMKIVLLVEDNIAFAHSSTGDIGGAPATTTELIHPHSCFSAPNSYNATVRDMVLTCPMPLYNSYVEETDQSFRTRTFYVRYRDERHDMNDGVLWRIKVPNVDMSSLHGNAPALANVISVQFDLLCCEYMDTAGVDLMYQLDKVIPEDPVFSVVDSQILCIQRAASGINEYYNITFSNQNFASVDVTIHTAATNIQFHLNRETLKSLEGDIHRPEHLSLDHVSLHEKRLPANIVSEHSSAIASSHSTDRQSTELSANECKECDGSDKMSVSRSDDDSGKSMSDNGFNRNSMDDSRHLNSSTASTTTAAAAATSSPVRAGDRTPSKKTFSSSKAVATATPNGTSQSNAKVTTNESSHKSYSSGKELTKNLMNMFNASSDFSGGTRPLTKLYRGVTLPIHLLDHGNMICVRYQEPHAIHDCVHWEQQSNFLLNRLNNDSKAIAVFHEFLMSFRSIASNLELFLRAVVEMGVNDKVSNSVSRITSNKDKVVKYLSDAKAAELAANRRKRETSEKGNDDMDSEQSLLASIKPDMFESDMKDDNSSDNNSNSDSKSSKQLTLLQKLSFDYESVLLEIVEKNMDAEIESRLDVEAAIQDFENLLEQVNCDVGAQWSKAIFELRQSSVLIPIHRMTSADILHHHNSQIHKHRNKDDSSKAMQSSNAQDIMTALRSRYQQQHRKFWQGQMTLHRVSVSYVSKPHKAESDAITSLLSMVKQEHTRRVQVKRGFEIGSVESSSIAPIDNQVVFARGLTVFDPKVHKNYPKLPVMLCQTYFEGRALQRGSSTQTNSGAPLHCESLQRCGYELWEGREVYETCQDPSNNNNEIDSDINNNNSNNTQRQHKGSDPLSRSNAMKIKHIPLDNHNHNHHHHHNSRRHIPHLVVLVHGFQGTSYDMRLLRNTLLSEQPHLTVLCAKSNDDHNEDSIREMAKRLSKEVMDYCRENFTLALREGTECLVSFIGHSMGGLVIRCCLEDPLIKPLLNHLYIYMSLSTPHAGTFYTQSRLVSTGMWALLQLKQSSALKELSMEDYSVMLGSIKKTLLYQLSENGALQFFEKIVLFSSPNDTYVPTYSARIQANNKADIDPKHGEVVTSMIANILSDIDSKNIIRVTVSNNGVSSDNNNLINVDDVIGRTAHICYLDNINVAREIVFAFFHLFE